MPLFCRVKAGNTPLPPQDGQIVKEPVAMKTHVHSEATPMSEGRPDYGKTGVHTPAQAYKYAMWNNKPYPEGSPEEALIAQQANYAVYYARKVLKKRFPKGEPEIFKSPKFSYLYATYFFRPKHGGDVVQRIAQMEDSIAKDPQYSYLYAVDVLWNKRFEKGEAAMHKDPEVWRHYLEHLAFVKALPRDTAPPEPEIQAHPSRHSKQGALVPEMQQYAFKEYKQSFCQRMFERVMSRGQELKSRLGLLKQKKVNESLETEKEEFFKADTLKHIHRVAELLTQISAILNKRGIDHDKSKFEEPEHSAYIDPVWQLNGGGGQPKVEFGSPEYKEIMKVMAPGFKHHSEVNDHHAEHFQSEDPISEMTLMHLAEMLCDWISASERKPNDPLMALEQLKKKFPVDPQVQALLKNTIETLVGKFEDKQKTEEAKATSAPSEDQWHVESSDSGKQNGTGAIVAPRALLPFELNEDEYIVKKEASMVMGALDEANPYAAAARAEGEQFETYLLKAFKYIGLDFVQPPQKNAFWDFRPKGPGWEKILKDMNVDIKIENAETMFSLYDPELTKHPIWGRTADTEFSKSFMQRIARQLKSMLDSDIKVYGINKIVYLKPKDNQFRMEVMQLVRELAELAGEGPFAGKTISRDVEDPIKAINELPLQAKRAKEELVKLLVAENFTVLQMGDDYKVEVTWKKERNRIGALYVYVNGKQFVRSQSPYEYQGTTRMQFKTIRSGGKSMFQRDPEYLLKLGGEKTGVVDPKTLVRLESLNIVRKGEDSLCLAEAMHFVTDCTASGVGNSISDMKDKAKKISKRAFLQEIDPEEAEMYSEAINDNYTYFYRSTYRGRPCVYYVFSGIEHVFV